MAILGIRLQSQCSASWSDTTCYRFFINSNIRAFADAVVVKYGESNETVMLFPTTAIAERCRDFLLARTALDPHAGQCEASSEKRIPPTAENVRILDLVSTKGSYPGNDTDGSVAMVSAVLYPASLLKLASKFWQHTGEGISSRQAAFFLRAFNEKSLAARPSRQPEQDQAKSLEKGPKRYRKDGPPDQTLPGSEIEEASHVPGRANHSRTNAEYARFIEERFGRNLDVSMAKKAKLAIQRRIVGSLRADVNLDDAMLLPDSGLPSRSTKEMSENVYLYPTGMSSIYNTHRFLLTARGDLKSIMFGFVRSAHKYVVADTH